LAAWCNAAARYEHNMRLAAKSDVIPVRGAKPAGLDLPKTDRSCTIRFPRRRGHISRT
jgi:hypothetical protein